MTCAFGVFEDHYINTLRAVFRAGHRKPIDVCKGFPERAGHRTEARAAGTDNAAVDYCVQAIQPSLFFSIQAATTSSTLLPSRSTRPTISPISWFEIVKFRTAR